MQTPQSHFLHPKYRPDIDGLRAIAVLSVIVFHAFPSVLQGGFIGVDIFFVISGFLISTIIFENLDKGTFSFAEFYARRIKRIFPALFLVLLTCFILGWLMLMPGEYKQLGKHIAAGAGFVSNFILLNESGYFDNSAETKPLLHLWSLGVEEQFYFIWPLLIWLAWKRRFNFLVILIIIAFVSFYLNIKYIERDPVAAFYSPQTRFWELMCGSLLAWITVYKKNTFAEIKYKLDCLLGAFTSKQEQNPEGKISANLISFMGFTLLVFGLVYIRKDFTFPGMWALVPVLGAVLIISAGPKAWINNSILSNKFAVWFGLVSFPLYLWHWPLLSFARIVEGGIPTEKIRLVSLLISIILAWFTYKFIERPIRLGKQNKMRISVLVMLMIMVAGAGIYVKDHRGLKFRNVVNINHVLNSGADGSDGKNMIDGCGIENESASKLFGMCATDKRGNVRFALMGDSKASALHGGLVRTSSEEGRWLVIGGNGSHGAPLPLLTSDQAASNQLTVFAIDAIIKNKDIDTVVLVSAVRAIFAIDDFNVGESFGVYNYKYLSRLSTAKNFDVVYDQLNRVVKKFVNSGKKVVLVVDNPALPSPEDCVVRQTSLSFINNIFKNVNQDCFVPINVFNDEIKIYRDLLAKVQASYPEGTVKIFDPTSIYCNKNTGFCEPLKNGRLMYSDTDHISDYAAGLVGKELNKLLVGY